jgi:hypothetical protein
LTNTLAPVFAFAITPVLGKFLPFSLLARLTLHRSFSVPAISLLGLPRRALCILSLVTLCAIPLDLQLRQLRISISQASPGHALVVLTLTLVVLPLFMLTRFTLNQTFPRLFLVERSLRPRIVLSPGHPFALRTLFTFVRFTLSLPTLVVCALGRLPCLPTLEHLNLATDSLRTSPRQVFPRYHLLDSQLVDVG